MDLPESIILNIAKILNPQDTGNLFNSCRKLSELVPRSKHLLNQKKEVDYMRAAFTFSRLLIDKNEHFPLLEWELGYSVPYEVIHFTELDKVERELAHEIQLSTLYQRELDWPLVMLGKEPF